MAEIIRRTAAGASFTHYQNPDVNLWLYNNFGKLCKDNGVEFEIAK